MSEVASDTDPTIAPPPTQPSPPPPAATRAPGTALPPYPEAPADAAARLAAALCAAADRWAPAPVLAVSHGHAVAAALRLGQPGAAAYSVDPCAWVALTRPVAGEGGGEEGPECGLGVPSYEWALAGSGGVAWL